MSNDRGEPQNEEDNTGALTTTFVDAPQGAVGPVLADVAGSNPASGAYRYYTLDHLGSTNGLYDGAKAKISALAYTPYGASYSDVGPGPLPRYTGHLWDGAAGLHLAPYRAYAPDLARWLSRDPLGMVDGPNVYTYVVCNPIAFFDPLGLKLTDEKCQSNYLKCIQRARGQFIRDFGWVGIIVTIAALGVCLATGNPWICAGLLGLASLYDIYSLGRAMTRYRARVAGCKGEYDYCLTRCP